MIPKPNLRFTNSSEVGIRLNYYFLYSKGASFVTLENAKTLKSCYKYLQSRDNIVKKDYFQVILLKFLRYFNTIQEYPYPADESGRWKFPFINAKNVVFNVLKLKKIT